jgi:hypothetical protein
MAENIYMIKNARCSFPHLFERPIINGDEGKCGAKLLLNPQEPAHHATIKQINAAIEALIKETFRGQHKIPADKRCLRKGEDTTRPEYEGFHVISTNHNTKPVVIGGDGQSVITSQEQCPIYSGCRVNAKIQLWVQNNKHGKRVNATLVAIQFAGDDEPFSGSHIPVAEAMDGFESFGDSDQLDASFDDAFDDAFDS